MGLTSSWAGAFVVYAISRTNRKISGEQQYWTHIAFAIPWAQENSEKRYTCKEICSKGLDRIADITELGVGLSWKFLNNYLSVQSPSQVIFDSDFVLISGERGVGQVKNYHNDPINASPRNVMHQLTWRTISYWMVGLTWVCIILNSPQHAGNIHCQWSGNRLCLTYVSRLLYDLKYPRLICLQPVVDGLPDFWQFQLSKV